MKRAVKWLAMSMILTLLIPCSLANAAEDPLVTKVKENISTRKLYSNVTKAYSNKKGFNTSKFYAFTKSLEKYVSDNHSSRDTVMFKMDGNDLLLFASDNIGPDTQLDKYVLSVDSNGAVTLGSDAGKVNNALGVMDEGGVYKCSTVASNTNTTTNLNLVGSLYSPGNQNGVAISITMEPILTLSIPTTEFSGEFGEIIVIPMSVNTNLNRYNLRLTCVNVLNEFDDNVSVSKAFYAGHSVYNDANSFSDDNDSVLFANVQTSSKFNKLCINPKVSKESLPVGTTRFIYDVVLSPA